MLHSAGVFASWAASGTFRRGARNRSTLGVGDDGLSRTRNVWSLRGVPTPIRRARDAVARCRFVVVSATSGGAPAASSGSPNNPLAAGWGGGVVDPSPALGATRRDLRARTADGAAHWQLDAGLLCTGFPRLSIWMRRGSEVPAGQRWRATLRGFSGLASRARDVSPFRMGASDANADCLSRPDDSARRAGI